jgi:hypothetical protein
MLRDGQVTRRPYFELTSPHLILWQQSRDHAAGSASTASGSSNWASSERRIDSASIAAFRGASPDSDVRRLDRAYTFDHGNAGVVDETEAAARICHASAIQHVRARGRKGSSRATAQAACV